MAKSDDKGNEEEIKEVSLIKRVAFMREYPTTKKILQEIQEAIDADPMDYWLWHILCQIHILLKDIDSAFAACKSGTEKFPNSPSPLMELSNLHAMIFQYSEAIKLQLQLFENKRLEKCIDSAIESARQAKEKLIPPAYSERENEVGSDKYVQSCKRAD